MLRRTNVRVHWGGLFVSDFAEIFSGALSWLLLQNQVGCSKMEILTDV